MLKIKRIPMLALIIFFYAVLYLFCCETGASNLEYLKWKPIEFHYNSFVILMLVIICFAYYAFRKRIIIDGVFLLLLIRAIIMIIPLTYNNATMTYNAGNYLTNICAPLLYILFRRDNREWQEIGFRFFSFFGMALVCELIIAWLMSEYSWLTTYYKFYMGIPLGKSNSIGCFLLSIYGMIDLNLAKLRKHIKTLLMVLLVIGGILIKSRSFFVVFFIYYIIKFIITKKKKINAKRFIVCMLLLSSIVILFAMYGDIFLDYGINFIVGNFYDISGSTSLFDRITSNRGEVLRKVYVHITDHPLLGNGLDYSAVGGQFAHNLLVDLLFQSGIIGTFLYISAVGLSLRNSIKHNPNREEILIPVIILINAFFEPGLLMFPMDFIFWIVMGYTCNFSGASKNRELDNIRNINNSKLNLL